MDLKLPKQRVMQQPAPFFRRLVGLVIDVFIINLIILWPFQDFFASISLDQALTIETTISPTLMLAMFFVSLLALAYFVLFEYYQKQTIGMMLMKIKAEGKLTIGTIIIRNLFAVPFFPFYLLWIIDPIYLLFSGARLTEKITKTQTNHYATI